MKCLLGDYTIKSKTKLLSNGKYSVSCEISKCINGVMKKAIYYDNERIALILKEEADNESINLGKNIIKNLIIDF